MRSRRTRDDALAQRSRPPTGLLLDYCEGELGQSDADALLSRSRGFDAIALKQQKALVERLREPPAGGVDNLDLLPAIRHAIARRPSARRLPRLALPALVAAASLALALALGVVIAPRGQGAHDAAESGAFRVKGSSVEPGDRWAGLQVYRLAPHGRRAQRLGANLSRDDSLLFAYTNLGPRPFRYLSVFAVDPRGSVFWFFPAYLREGTDPEAIAIAEGRAGVELPEAIRHHFRTGPLVICGLFTREPWRVSQVEALVRDAVQEAPLPGALERVRPPESSVQLIRVEVTR